MLSGILCNMECVCVLLANTRIWVSVFVILSFFLFSFLKKKKENPNALDTS